MNSGRIVYGYGPTPCNIMVIGEAPETNEVKAGIPFVGAAGDEFNNYLMLTGLQRTDMHIDNVFQWQIPLKSDLKKKYVREHLSKQLPDLMRRVARVQPQLIITLGVIAKDCFMDMELAHGIPHKVDVDSLTVPVVVFPCYHPAAGIHDPSQIIKIRDDFKRLSMYLNGELDVWQDKSGNEHYQTDTLPDYAPVIGVDTETIPGRVWSVQVSTSANTGHLIWANDDHAIQSFYERFKDSLWVLHNAVFDYAQLKRIGIAPGKFVDSMNMAYLLGDEPQALKTLAYRYLGKHRKSYPEMVYPATQQKAESIIQRAESMKWERPPKTMKDGKPYQPQSVATKLKRLRTDQGKNSDLDLYARWKNIECDETIEQVGFLQEGNLSDIDVQDAVRYACADADDSLQIAWILARRMVEEGLPFNYNLYGGLL